MTAAVEPDPPSGSEPESERRLEDDSLVAVPAERFQLGRARLQNFYDLLRVLSSAPAGASPLEQALETAAKSAGADRGFIGLRSPPSPLEVVAQYRMDATSAGAVSRTLIRHAADQGRTVLYPNPTVAGARAADPPALSSRGVASMVAAPVPVLGRPTGLLYLDRTAGGPFTRDDLDFTVAAARGIGLFEERRRLAEAELRSRRMLFELRTARDLQQLLFPPHPPEFAGYRLAAHNHPCIDASGDTYDVIDLGAGRLAVFIADVAGKGIEAAVIAGAVQTIFRTVLHLHGGRPGSGPPAGAPDLTEVVRTLNEHMTGRNAGRRQVQFVTFFAAVLDTRSATMTYINAGHDAPILLRADGTLGELDDARHIVLGLPEPGGYRQAACGFPPDAVLVLYTDGVTEAMNVKQEPFGEERFRAALTESAGRPAESLVDHIRSRLVGFVGETTRPSDDVTLLVISGPHVTG